MIGWRKAAAVAARHMGIAAAAPAMAQTTLRMVSHADIKILDPIWTTALHHPQPRLHGLRHAVRQRTPNCKVQPQMVGEIRRSRADKLT